MTLPSHTYKYEPVRSSFRDPSGFVYSRDGQFYRQVNQVYQENYAQLIDSGLYSNLVADDLLIPHQEVDSPSPQPDSAYKIIQPQILPFISYPYEWCFSELQDAALATLEIQRRSLSFGMSLKDSSAFNLQFQRGHPILIDTLSFERYQEGKPWTAYRQFCQHFLASLSLMAKTDIRLSQLLTNNIDGLPLDLTSRLLPWRSRFSPGLLFHIHLHAASQKRYANSTVETGRGVTRTAMLGLIDSLESAVRGLKWRSTSTAWSNYYQADHNYSQQGMEHKRQLVAEYLESIDKHIIWDIGANTGMFSRIAAANGAYTLSFDNDPGAVELNYRQCKSDRIENVLPLITDLTNPTPAIGWENTERLSLLDRANADAVLALALVHHLSIGNNLSFERIASFFRSLGKWLLIEFVPKEDPQVQRLLASREDIFTEYNENSFVQQFQIHYKIHRRAEIRDSGRGLYLMEGN
jgi:hypothetical protein